jgi:hypothetical protein
MVEHTHKTTNGSNKRLERTSFLYDKQGHHVKDFHHLKAKNMQASMIENIDGESI